MKLAYSIHTQFLVAHAGDCAAMKCEIPGQEFQTCAPACDATCTDPNPICTKQCTERCVCPKGTVLDKERNRCTRKCPRDDSRSELALPLNIEKNVATKNFQYCRM